MKIHFVPSSDEVAKYVPCPKPASNYIPKWYKDLPPVRESEIKLSGETGDFSQDLDGLGLKACMPFIDALTTGYIQETWTDILINAVDGRMAYGAPVPPQIIGHRKSSNVSHHSSYYPIEFTWKYLWQVKLPKGYSALITQPLNRIDLPFTVLSGVVDADFFHHEPIGNVPFYLKNDFEGIIPAGTPMYQIIPFKRDDWESSVVPYVEEESEQRHFELRKHIWGAYKNKFRQKKTYR